MAARDWFDLMDAGAGVKHHVARRQLDALRAKGVFNHQLATVIVFRRA